MCYKVYCYEYHSYINLSVINHSFVTHEEEPAHPVPLFCKHLSFLCSSTLPYRRAEQQQHWEYLKSSSQHIEHQNIFRKIRKMSEIRHRSNQRKPRTDIVKRSCYCREVCDQIFVLNRHKQYGYRENNHICHKIDICRPQRLMLEWFSLEFDLLHGTRMQIRNNFFYK